MIATLHIRTGDRNGITYLDQSYCTPPFKVANITEDKRARPLHLMLMNSSPGILDGDDYTMKIEVEENCCLCLHTQSYQRLFNMKNGARQSMEVRLAANAELIYLPHPAVPHEQSIFTAINKIYLDRTSSLVWGEILTCGRKLNGEVFRLSRYHNLTEVYLDDRIITRDNLLMQPTLVDPNSTGQLEGFTHQASMIIYQQSMNINEQADRIYEYLADQEKIECGVSITAHNGLIVRILGYAAEQLYIHLQKISEIVQLSMNIEAAPGVEEFHAKTQR
jgi:urease accessory protein